MDVFFVLSGFLITGLLATEWQRWGSIDLRRFWLRRARRLLPALFTLILILAVIGHAGPSDQRDRLRGDLLATLGYVANWHFIWSQDSYFDQFSAPSPLLHTWSLAIEEQWYLVFPPVLILVLGILTTSGTITARGRRLLAGGLAVAALCSAALMAALSSSADPSRLYYGTDTRVQALLVGAGLAIAFRSGARVPRRIGWIGAGSLCALFGMVFVVHDDSRWMYRGGFLLAACLSGAVLLAACRSGSAVQRALSAEPLRRLGVISYGLYLWHWPVVVYLDESRTNLHGVALFSARVVVMLVICALSYRFIEHPVRSGALRLRFGRRGAVRAGAAAAALVLVAALAGTSGATASTEEQFRTAAPPTATRAPGEHLVFMVGDSVPYGLALYFPSDAGLGFVVQDEAALGCGLIPVRTYVDGQAQNLLPVCKSWSDSWPAKAKAANPDLGAVFMGDGELFDQQGPDGNVLRFGTAEFETHLDAWLNRTVRALLSAGARRVALVTEPCHSAIKGPIGDIVNSTARISWLNSAVVRFARNHPTQTAVVDLNSYLCGHGYTNETGGVQLRSDGVHFTKDGARIVWSWLGPQFTALLAR